MRIIAGEFRGRRLLPPEETGTTRPITDRVKQSLFDILTPSLNDARVYDCFAGTGSMGLECLSRGAAHVTFFEGDRPALQRLTRNIETLDVGARSQVIGGNLFKWFSANPVSTPRNAIDLVFLDPPYQFVREHPDALRSLSERIAGGHMAAEGTVIFRHDARDTLDLPGLSAVDQRTYGGMSLEFLRRIRG